MQLCIPARLVAFDGNQRIQLDDLSASGARVRLLKPQAVSAGTLKWLGFEAFVQVVWQEGLRCGLGFEAAIPQEWLQETREFARGLGEERAAGFRKLASAWVHGPGDW